MTTQSAEPVRFTPRTDPTTFEVLRHRIWQINDEQGQTLRNVSGSPVANEANDFNVAIADRDGNLIAVGAYIVPLIATLYVMMQHLVQSLGDQVAEGDMFLCNDPWLGAAHQNDVSLIAPVFWSGRHIAWTASCIHQLDVGGLAPGSWCHEATEAFQEAPRYRFLRIVRNNEIQKEVLDTYMTNSREPRALELDLRAQVAAANVTRMRLQELCGKYGVETITATMADVLDYSDRLFRVRLNAIPDGRWQSNGYLDHDGKQETCARYAVTLTKAGTSLAFDYRATDPQLNGFINCAYGGLYAATFIAVLSFLCGDIPWNTGIMRHIEIISEEGRINNARFPAPVSGALESIWSTANIATSAMGKMLMCSESEFTSAMAVWQGSSLVYNFYGRDDRDNPYSSMLIYSGLGGAGARVIGDGYDNGGSINSPCYTAINVENAESLYPMLFLYRRRAADSGGPGFRRGGVSAESAITPHGTAEMSVRMTTSGSDHSHAAGLAGGYPGGASIGRLKRRGHSAGAAIPANWADVPGESEALTSKSRFVLKPGDVFSATPHGGGGYGDPLDREIERVRSDVVDGCVSPDFALRIYGVVIDAGTFEVDQEASQQRRREMRLIRAKSLVEAAASEGLQEAKTLRQGFIPSRGQWTCARCSSSLGRESENPKTHCVAHVAPTGTASPWVALRHAGNSPSVTLVEYSCPKCGQLLAVDQRRKTETADVHDYQIGPQ